jgi:hypothetical protein
MSVRCVNTDCGVEIEADWAFCPYCGEDNRPPAERREVGSHRHKRIRGFEHCVECGAARDGLTNKKRIRWILVFVTLGILLALFAFNIQLAHANKGALFSDWIQSWYENPVTHRRRRYGNTYTTPLGYDVTWYLFFGTIAALIFAIVIASKEAFQRRAYWQYDDDRPWYRRRGWPWW